MRLIPLGDSAVVLVLGDTVDAATAARVRNAAHAIRRSPPAGVQDVVPAFGSVGVFFEPVSPESFSVLCEQLRERVAASEAREAPESVRTVEIPVCYGGELGPDLGDVAAHARLSESEVISLHTGADYLVHAVGFAPGFPYLGGLPARLATPRRATPRPLVPAGAVGIGGAQTGVYPIATPGGWNVIGRTPLSLFDPARMEPTLLRAGDQIRFRAVERSEFATLAGTRDDPRQTDSTAAGNERSGVEGAEAAAGIEVVRPGMLTTVQDTGRRGWRAQGVPLSGAADSFALRLVNALVGNPEDAAGLEFTLLGPDLRFLRDSVVAFGGGDFSGVPRWQPFAVTAGTVIRFGPARSGCRGYLAIAGGIDVPPVLGSRSTYLRGGFGGWKGRALRQGDVLPVPPVQRRIGQRWRIDERILPAYAEDPVVRVVTGAQAEQFRADWTTGVFDVSSRADRMGARLNGKPLTRQGGQELVSSPVAPGTVQVPPDGQPIVLLADAQTIGGYPQLAQVARVDLPLVAQLRPGSRVRFGLVSLSAAQELAVAQEHALAVLRQGLEQKLA